MDAANMPTIEVRPTYPDDMHLLALDMRKDDRTEVFKAGGYSPLQALELSIDACEFPQTITTMDGTICGIFGVNRCNDTTGIPWMMGSTALYRVRREFLVRSAFYVQEAHETYELLTNLVWEGNTAHIRWLEHLGFTVDRHSPPLRPEFLHFWRYRDTKSETTHV